MCADALILVLVALIGFTTQEAVHSDHERPDVDVTVEPAWKNLHAQIMVLAPRAIGPDELDHYADLLTLSEAQRAYLDAYYHDYRVRIDVLDRNEGPGLVGLANVLAAHRAPSAEHAHAFEKWHHAENAFCDLLRQEDDRLFTALGMVVAESQQNAMRRVLLQRQRRRCVSEFFDLRKAQVDLSRCIEPDPSTFDLTPALTEVLADYDDALTPALVEADRTYRDSRLSLTMANWMSMYDDQDRALDPSAAAAQVRIQQANELYLSVNRQRGVTQTRVAAINDRFLTVLVGMLPELQSRRLLACWREQVYPRIYPDAFDPETVYQQVLAIPELRGDKRLFITSLWDSYRAKYLSVCEAMEKRNQQWHEQRAFSDNSFGWEEFEQAMAAWTRERDALTGAFMKSMRDGLPPEVEVKAHPFMTAWGKAADMEIRRRSIRGEPHIDGR